MGPHIQQNGRTHALHNCLGPVLNEPTVHPQEDPNRPQVQGLAREAASGYDAPEQEEEGQHGGGGHQVFREAARS